MASERALYLAGRFVAGETQAEVRSPWDHQVVARVAQAGRDQIDQALDLAIRERVALWTAPAGERHRLCAAIARGLEQRADELARVICAEAGKPITAARAEVSRAVWTFTLAAAAALEPWGETLPVDLDPAQRGIGASTRRVPSGVVVGISPFNFPLNLVAHKVAPALALGAPMILKPPPQAPSAALILAEVVHAAGAPTGQLFRSSPVTTLPPNAWRSIPAWRSSPSPAARRWGGRSSESSTARGPFWSSGATRRRSWPRTPPWRSRPRSSPMAATCTRGRSASRCSVSWSSARPTWRSLATFERPWRSGPSPIPPTRTPSWGHSSTRRRGWASRAGSMKPGRAEPAWKAGSGRAIAWPRRWSPKPEGTSRSCARRSLARWWW